MGYYTGYSLRAFNPKGNGLGLEIPLDESVLTPENCPGVDYAIDASGDTLDRVKWYDYDDDMKAYSKLFPELIFELTGEGEEPGDLWKAYYQNGTAQYCRGKIVYDEFSADKLSASSSMARR